MKIPTYKKQSMILDILLITTIFSIFLSIIFFTIIDKKALSQQSGAVSYSAPESEKTEVDSTFPNIKIVTDISSDVYIPFNIQYPVTKFDSINTVVNTYIDNEKTNYINKILIKNDGTDHQQAGNLTITMETFPYDEHYYSFLFKNIQELQGENRLETIFSLLMNGESGKIITFASLLNNNIESLQTLSTQISTTIEQDKLFSHLSKEVIQSSIAPNWENFNDFIISGENLIIYFDSLLDIENNTPLSVTIPLSTINPLLTEEFQIEMIEEAEEVVVVKENDRNVKRVALTFDDGPHPTVTPQILDLLDKYNAKATFFMLGSRVAYYPEIVQRVYESGHEIGDHTYNHPVLTKLSQEQILKEYTLTENAIFDAIGVNSTIFRPPYGATNELVEATISGTQITWTIDTLDWKYKSAAKLLPEVKKAMHNNAIILMHDIHQSTGDGLESVLQYLQAEGYEFVTVSEILKYN